MAQTKLERILYLIALWGHDYLTYRETADLYDAIAASPVAGPLEQRQQGAAQMAIEALEYFGYRGEGSGEYPQWLAQIGVDHKR